MQFFRLKIQENILKHKFAVVKKRFFGAAVIKNSLISVKFPLYSVLDLTSWSYSQFSAFVVPNLLQ